MSNDVKLSKRCLLSKNQIPGLWKVHKKYIDIMRFIRIDINFDITYDGNKNPQCVHRKYFWTILETFIFDVKLDINICKPYYVNLLLFVNLLHSPEI